MPNYELTLNEVECIFMDTNGIYWWEKIRKWQARNNNRAPFQECRRWFNRLKVNSAYNSFTPDKPCNLSEDKRKYLLKDLKTLIKDIDGKYRAMNAVLDGEIMYTDDTWERQPRFGRHKHDYRPYDDLWMRPKKDEMTLDSWETLAKILRGQMRPDERDMVLEVLRSIEKKLLNATPCPTGT